MTTDFNAEARARRELVDLLRVVSGRWSELETLLPLVLAELDRLDGENAKLRDRLDSALGWVNLAANLLRPEENR